MVYSQLSINRLANAVVELGAWALGRRRRLRVSGQSMQPTLVDGDYLLAKPVPVSTLAVLDGKMVIAKHPHTGVEIVKRVESVRPGGLWLLSDNPAEGSDSRRFGIVNPESVTDVVTMVLNRPFNSSDSFG